MSGVEPGPDAGGSASPVAAESFRRVHPVTPLLRSGLVVVAVGTLLVRQLLEGADASTLFVVPVAVVGALVLGAASWWFTRFRISPSELRIDSGVLVRRQRRMRIERIQAVEVEQPLLARLFGMAELRIEVAAGEGGTLAYLTLRDAESLRHTLLEQAGTASPADHSDPQMPAAVVTLFRVDDSRLLAATLLRTDVLTPALGAVAGVVATLLLGRVGGVAIVVPLALATVGVAWKGYTTGFGTTLTRAERGLRLRAGLLDVRTQSVPTGRVQGLVVVEPLLWRWFGWARVDVTVAGAGSGEDEHGTGVLVPVAQRREVDALLPLVLDGADPRQVVLDPAPRRARWVDPVGAGVLGVGLGDRLLVTRRGVLTRRTDVVPLPKPQSVHVAQGPVQRLLRLASVQVHLPPGPVGPQGAHRDAAAAWALATSVTAWRTRPDRSPPAGAAEGDDLAVAGG